MNIFLVGRECVAKLMNLKNEVDKELKNYTPTLFYCHKYQYWKEIRVILGGTMKDLLWLEKIIVDIAITLSLLLFLFLIILRR